MLFLLYVSISLGIQVQRLQNQVGFVGDEVRDLRLFGLQRAEGDMGRDDRYQGDHPASSARREVTRDEDEIQPDQVAKKTEEEVVRRGIPDKLRVAIERDSLPPIFEHIPATMSVGLCPERSVPRINVLSHTETGLGRVVWGKTTWERWTAHPTLVLSILFPFSSPFPSEFRSSRL